MCWLVVSDMWVLVDGSKDIEDLVDEYDAFQQYECLTVRPVTLRSSSNASMAKSADAAPPSAPNIE
jgi:hypothetical protein